MTGHRDQPRQAPRDEPEPADRSDAGAQVQRRAHERLWSSLERAGLPMAQVDRAGRIARATTAMGRLLANERPVVQREGSITGETREIAEALRQLLQPADAVRSSLDVVDSAGRTWRLTAVRHGAAHPFSAAMLRFTLLVQHRPDEAAARAALNERFGLTPAESRCLLALPELGDVPSLARAFEVSPETIRSQLRSVFAKTGTGSQAELMLLLAREGLIGGE